MHFWTTNSTLGGPIPSLDVRSWWFVCQIWCVCTVNVNGLVCLDSLRTSHTPYVSSQNFTVPSNWRVSIPRVYRSSAITVNDTHFVRIDKNGTVEAGDSKSTHQRQ